VPQTRELLTRMRVDNLLAESIKKPLTTVVAGPGYGKTTAVASFASRVDADIIWLSLSEQDNLPTRFWENLTHAGVTINKDLADRLLHFGFPATQNRFHRFLDMFMDELKPRRQYIFIVDDLHLIHDEDVLGFIERFVTERVPYTCTVLIARENPRIAASLIQSGSMARVTERDLRFTKEELSRFLRMRGVVASAGFATELYLETEGWPFAIAVAAVLLTMPGGEQHIRHALNAHISRFIMEEIFAPLPESVQKFLVMLSFIDHLPSDLLQRLSPGMSPLEDIPNFSIFLRYDEPLNTYHIHQLFQSFLRSKQDILTEEEKRAAFCETARWCLENNYLMDAIRYFDQARDYAELVDVVYTLPQLIQPDTAERLLEALERAPESIYEEIPAAVVTHTRLLISLGRFDEALAEIAEKIARYEKEPDSPQRSRVLYGEYYNEGIVHLLQAQYTGDFESIVKAFQNAAEYHDESIPTLPGPVRITSVGVYVCRVSRSDPGELNRFVGAIRAAVSYAAQTLGGSMYGLDDLASAEIAFFKGDVRTCEQFAMQAVYKGREKGQHEIVSRAFFYLLRANVALGNHTRIYEIFEELEKLLEISDFTQRQTMYDIDTSWYYAVIDRMDMVKDWLKGVFSVNGMNTFANGPEDFVRACCHLSMRRHEDLLIFLESRSSEYAYFGYLFGKIEINVHKAICRFKLDDREGAMQLLEDAYRLAAPGGIDMPFIEPGVHIRNLVNLAIKLPGGEIPKAWLKEIRIRISTHVKRIQNLKMMENALSIDAEQTAPTEREIDLLADISQGLSLAEIAAKRKQSVQSVKLSLRILYDKLGTESSMDAVRIATSKGYF